MVTRGAGNSVLGRIVERLENIGVVTAFAELAFRGRWLFRAVHGVPDAFTVVCPARMPESAGRWVVIITEALPPWWVLMVCFCGFK
jgi:hypothetical protein